MTTRKSKGKGKGKGNSHRNGRTKRGGGFTDMFKNSFSWFGNNPKPNETTETTEPAPSKFDWSFGLSDKLQPPTIPEGKPGPIIPGRPVTQQPPQQQDMPDAVTQDLTTSSQADQAPPQEAAVQAQQSTAVQAQQAPPPQEAVKGGRRLRLRTKKRSYRCKRK